MQPKSHMTLAGNEIWLNDQNKLHREDGPAIISPSNNNQFYCLDGKSLSFEVWCDRLALSDNQIMELRLKWL